MVYIHISGLLLPSMGDAELVFVCIDASKPTAPSSPHAYHLQCVWNACMWVVVALRFAYNHMPRFLGLGIGTNLACMS